MEEICKKLRNLSRSHMHGVWKLYKSGVSIKKEDRRLAQIMDEHEEYHRSWEMADDLGDAEHVVEGVNPFLHIQFHAVVENQLTMGSPRIVRKVAKRLKRLGLPRHEIVHAIGRAVSNQIYNMLKRNITFDEREYIKDLNEIVKDYQRGPLRR